MRIGSVPSGTKGIAFSTVAGFFLLGMSPVKDRDQSWTKVIAPGLTYQMTVQTNPARLIHILRWNPASIAVTAKSALPGNVVFSPNANRGKGKVSEIVATSNAIAGINGDYFGSSGDPLGLMVRNSQLVSLPFGSRAAFAWGPGRSEVGTAKFTGKVILPSGESIRIDGVNEECGENAVVLNTPDAGLSISKSPCLTLVLKVDGNQLPPSTHISGTVTYRTNDATSLPLEPKQFTIVARGSKVKALSGAKTGATVEIDVQTSGFDWPSFEHVIGGGPFLLKKGKEEIDWKEEGFPIDRYASRHPRTAIGRTAEGEIVSVVVDGRQEVSVGATLPELADIMKNAGCVDAINLDGGGSSTLNLLGVPVNRPSDPTGERAVANGVVFLGPRISDDGTPLTLVVNPTVSVGKSMDARVEDGKNASVRNIEVIWSMQGSAWVDQGGKITGVKAGVATLTAIARGRKVSCQVRVVP